MQYTISMTSRMLAITVFCAFLLCVLLFLLGIELGKRFSESEPSAPAASAATTAEKAAAAAVSSALPAPPPPAAAAATLAAPVGAALKP